MRVTCKEFLLFLKCSLEVIAEIYIAHYYLESEGNNG